MFNYLENKLHGIIIAANCTDIYFDAKKWHVTFCSAKHQFRIDFVDAIYLSVYDTDTNIYKHLFIQHDTHNKIDFATIHEIISTY